MSIELNNDIYFSNCIGVFQGGGCKALAYIGAYEEACRHGIMFSELAGTSAGSIIAALIAMGATPEKLKQIIYNLDFTDIIPSPVKPPRKPVRKLLGISTDKKWTNWKIDCYFKFNEWALNKFAKTSNKKLFQDFSHQNLIENYGIYDSGALTAILKIWFQEVSGKSDPLFKDLIVDLHVISCDLLENKIKIWDKDKTPDESIAKAVTASCSIPIFFTPTENRYVDGGVLSNRPDFVFEDAPNYFRTLSFILKGQKADMGSFTGYVSSLVDTIIQGADEIQHKKSHVSEVLIECEEVGATDFDKMSVEKIDYLLESGRSAMKDFLDNSKEDLTDIITPRIHLFNLEQVYSQVAFWSLSAYSEITVVSDSLDWVWNLFPTIKSWSGNNTKLLVYYNSLKTQTNRTRRLNELIVLTKGEDKETIRQKALQRLEKETCTQEAQKRFLLSIGAKIHSPKGKSVNPQGFYFKKGNINRAIIYKTIDGHFEGKIYNEKIDSHAIQSQLQLLDTKNSKHLGQIKFKPVNESAIIEKLSKISHYTKSTFSWEVVKLSDLRFLNEFIRGSKYKQIVHIFNLYPDDYELFSSGTLILNNNQESLIGPIVAERKNGELFIIEVNTRCLFAYRHKIQELKILIVDNVSAPLPVNMEERPKGFSIEEVRISEKGLAGTKRYKDFDYSLFRPIEQTLRPDNEYLL